jgi:hypothetical protein
VNKIICYYPGAGGSRFKNKLLSKEYTTIGRIYDKSITEHRYLLEDYYRTHTADDILQLHCMNIDLIKSFFSNVYIYMIQSDLKRSLMRYWTTRGKNNTQFENVLDSAFNYIAWHIGYYNKYPVQELADEYINIDNSTEFGKIILNEFEHSTDEIFELAWKIYHEQGPTAPIIDIWNQLYDKK